MLESPKPGFNGRIHWSFSDRTCEWSKPEMEMNCASFGALAASDNDEIDCSTSFEEWILAEECCDRRYEGAIKKGVDQIWLAALQEWATQWDFPCRMTETELLVVRRYAPLKEPEEGDLIEIGVKGPVCRISPPSNHQKQRLISYWLVKIRLN